MLSSQYEFLYSCLVHSGVLGVHAVLLSVMGAASEVIVVMLQIVVEVPGTVCDVDCSIFPQTVDRQHPPTADRNRSGMSGDMLHLHVRWRSVAVMMNPLHAGGAYVSRDTTTARKTACRPISVIPWCRSTRSAYSDCAVTDK